MAQAFEFPFLRRRRSSVVSASALPFQPKEEPSLFGAGLNWEFVEVIHVAAAMDPVCTVAPDPPAAAVKDVE